MSIDNLQTRAKENIKEQQRIREAELKRASEIRANIQQYRTVQREQSNNLTYANVDKIMQLDIKSLINHFEKDNQQYKEGSYDMLKTSNAKYSIIDNNVAHDFKNLFNGMVNKLLNQLVVNIHVEINPVPVFFIEMAGSFNAVVFFTKFQSIFRITFQSNGVAAFQINESKHFVHDLQD